MKQMFIFSLIAMSLSTCSNASASDDLKDECVKAISEFYGNTQERFPVSNFESFVKSTMFSGPEDEVGASTRYAFIGDARKGMMIFLTADLEKRIVFNQKYGFKISKPIHEKKWTLIAMEELKDVSAQIYEHPCFAPDNTIGKVDICRVLNDDSFQIESVDVHEPGNSLVACRFKSSYSERPDYVLNGGILLLDRANRWRVDSYRLRVKYSDGLADVQSTNEYSSTGQLEKNSITNFVGSKEYATVVKNISNQIPQELFSEFDELYFLSDYGFPEPPTSSSELGRFRVLISIAVLFFVAAIVWKLYYSS